MVRIKSGRLLHVQQAVGSHRPQLTVKGKIVRCDELHEGFTSLGRLF